MTEPGKTCSHGIPWHADCPECNLISARELVAHWGRQVDEARALIAKDRLINQCDGCQIGAPINEYGHHRYSDGSLMGCTRERYEQTSEEQK